MAKIEEGIESSESLGLNWFKGEKYEVKASEDQLSPLDTRGEARYCTPRRGAVVGLLMSV